jgi:hypothetical protein
LLLDVGLADVLFNAGVDVGLAEVVFDTGALELVVDRSSVPRGVAMAAGAGAGWSS